LGILGKKPNVAHAGGTLDLLLEFGPSILAAWRPIDDDGGDG
jgi:hypothetical protein